MKIAFLFFFAFILSVQARNAFKKRESSTTKIAKFSNEAEEEIVPFQFHPETKGK